MKEKFKRLISWSVPAADRNVGDYSNKERNIFLMAMFGQNIIFGMVGNYLSFYYTSIILVPTTALLIITVISRIWDAINDVMMGTVADRTSSKWGKFRPYLKYMPIPIMLLTITLFLPIRNWNDIIKVIFVIITWLGWETAYTLGDIPLWGVASVITPDEQKRSKLISAARIIGSISGVIVVVFDTIVDMFAKINIGWGTGVDRPGVDAEFYNWQQGYLFAAIAIALVGGILFKCAFPYVRERVIGEDVTREEKFTDGFTQNLKYMWKNKPFMLVMLSQVLGCTKNMVMSVGIYFCTWVLANGGNNTLWLMMLGGSFLVPMLVSMSLATKFERLMGKKEISIWASYLNAIPYFAIFFVIYTFGIQTWAIVVACVLFAVSGFLTGFVTVYPTTMVADCTDYMEWKTGKRLDGVYFSGLNFQAKLQAAITMAITYVVFMIVNYTPIIGELSDKVQQGIIDPATYDFVADQPKLFVALLVLITVIPAVGSILQAIPIHFYELTEKKCDEMRADLEVRRAAAREDEAKAAAEKAE